MKCNEHGATFLIALMRFTCIQLFLLVTGCSLLYASGIKAQMVFEKKISISKEHASIESILIRIEDKADIRFVYTNNLFDIDKKVSVNYHDETLGRILNDLFEGDGIAFRFVDKNFIVLRKQHPSTSEHNAAKSDSP